MKRCPHCQEVFADRNLVYCRNDGNRLVSIPDTQSESAPTLLLPSGGNTQRLDDNDILGKGGVWPVTSEVNWLDGNRELPVCLAQPTPVGVDDILSDASRPKSLSLAEAIFGNKSAEVPLAIWFNQQAGVVLFPEYAFGSSDFTPLNDLIRSFSGRVIVCAGFGIVRGDSLRQLLMTCEPTWQKGAGAIDPDGHYNAGWCWIHEGRNHTRCYLFLKNFLDQQVELQLPVQVTPGKSIFQIVANDLVFYPLICADLISEQAMGPRARIRSSLPVIDGHPDTSKKVMVAALLYTQQPYHTLWHPAINEIVKLHQNSGGLVTVNQPYTDLPCDVEEDRWRCLSGAFISRTVMKGHPPPLLQPVRYVQTDSASGLILRASGVGVSCGAFRWVDNALEGRNVWVPSVRRFWDGNQLAENRESALLHEFKRYVRRHKPEILKPLDRSAHSMVSVALDRVANETQENRVSPRLWPRLLTGVEKPPVALNFDSIDAVGEALDGALAAFAGVEETTGGEPLTNKSHQGQLLWQDREILVWNSHTSDSPKMIHLLRVSCLERQGERMLIVFGKGRSGYREAQKLSQKIHPDRLTDISTNRVNQSYAQDRVRHVFWCPLQDVENILLMESDEESKKRAIMRLLDPKMPELN